MRECHLTIQEHLGASFLNQWEIDTLSLIYHLSTSSVNQWEKNKNTTHGINKIMDVKWTSPMGAKDKCVFSQPIIILHMNRVLLQILTPHLMRKSRAQDEDLPTHSRIHLDFEVYTKKEVSKWKLIHLDIRVKTIIKFLSTLKKLPIEKSTKSLSSSLSLSLLAST